MTYHVLTLFPDIIEQMAGTSILGRAQKSGSISLNVYNIRDFSVDRNGRVDDYPYGGGAGMVMQAEPVYKALRAACANTKGHARVIYLTPQAEVLTQTKAEELALEDELVLLCGHYEGIDERVLEEMVTDYISIGDYVLTGGELAAGVLIDAVSRFVPGVLSNDESSQFESIQDNLLEYPQYSRPAIWHEKPVPEVLMCGDHEKVNKWRYEQSLIRTKERRPDLISISRAVHVVFFGDTEEQALKILEKISRYGEILDYNRKKLQKKKREFSENDAVVFFADDAEAADDAVTANEAETAGNAVTAEEALKKVKGNKTRAVLFVTKKQAEKNDELKALLDSNGFIISDIFGTECFSDEKQTKKTAIKIRRAFEK